MSVPENTKETTRLGGITGAGVKPGQSGNPGGRPKGIARAFRDTMGSPEEAARGLLEIAHTAKRPADRIVAWREFLDRGWGKAPAFAVMEAGDPLELGPIAREIQQIADELQARRDARDGHAPALTPP